MLKKKRILLVTHNFTVTGAPLSLLNVAKVLQRDYEVSVWGWAGGPLLSQYQEELGIEPVIINPKYQKYPFYFVGELNKFDFVILNTILNSRLALVCQKNNIPYMWMIREAQDITVWHTNTLCKIIKKCQDNIYVVSEYAKDYLDNTYNVDVKVIHNFVPDEYVEKAKESSNILQFTFLGSIEKRKGIDLIIEAFLQQKLANWRLSICGEGGFKDYCIRKFGVSPMINWLGVVTGEERRKIFETTDIFLVPSLDESCSRVVLEAMMMGCPVIISENVGAKYMVNEHTGWIVKTGDIESLKECIKNILEKPPVIVEMGKHARNMFLTTSTEKIYSKNIYSIIEPAMEQSLKIRQIRFLKQKFCDLLKVIYFLISKIFSVTNQIKGARCRKVVTILGISFKLRNKEKEQQMAQAVFRSRSLQIQNELMNRLYDMEVILNEQRKILKDIASNEEKSLLKR